MGGDRVKPKTSWFNSLAKKNKEMAEQPAKPAAPAAPAKAPAVPKQPELRHLVRIGNVDLNGKKTIGFALANVKGVGINLAHAACKLANVPVEKKTGALSDAEIKKLDDIVRNPSQAGVPAWMLNRQKDPETGTAKHVLSGDLQFTIENDIKMMRKIKSYKGIRHSQGAPVRGQRTRSNFRRNKGKVMGVKKVKTGKKQ